MSVTLEIPVYGMTCGHCVSTVTKAITELTIVASVTVDLDAERATVVLQEEITEAVGRAEVEEAVEDVGFELTPVTPVAAAATVEVAVDDEKQTGETKQVALDVAEESQTLFVYDVTGMTCSSCVNAIERHVAALDYTATAAVNYNIGQLQVALYGSSSEVEALGLAETVAKEVVDLGYGCVLQQKQQEGGHRVNQLAAKMAAESVAAKRKLLFALVFSVPVFFLAMIAPQIPPLMELLMQPAFNSLAWHGLLLWVLTTPVQFGVGSVFLVAAYKGLRHGNANMSVLITIGTLAAYGFSLIAVIDDLMTTPEPMDMHMEANSHEMNPNQHFFETSSTLITFVLLGKYLEHLAKGKTSEALTALMDLTPKTALKVTLQEPVTDVNSSSSSDKKDNNNNNNNISDGDNSSENDHENNDHQQQQSETAATVEFKVLESVSLPVEQLHKGDLLMVKRGAQIPMDGVVHAGGGTVDEAMLTGESMPVSKHLNSKVMGGTICVEGTLIVRVTQDGNNSTLHNIVKLMEQAQLTKAPIQAFADHISSIFVPIVVVIAVLAGSTWAVLVATEAVPAHYYEEEGKVLFALLFGIAVLVIACPCALGLATPTAVMVGTGVGAKHGILIKGGEALEIAHNVTAFVFDKTGTLTDGKPSVVAFELIKIPLSEQKQPRAAVLAADDTEDNHSSSSSSSSSSGGNSSAEEKEEADIDVEMEIFDNKEALICLMAAAELESEHVLADAVVQYAEGLAGSYNGLQFRDLPRADFQAISGRGLTCKVSGHTVRIGNRAFFYEKYSDVHKDLAAQMYQFEVKGYSALIVGVDQYIVAVVAVADKVKDTALSLVNELNRRNFQVWMCTGDNRITAGVIAEELNISHIQAEVMPADKHLLVKSLQEQGQVVAMIGDGINDSPAIAQADLGISVGAATDIAMEAAQVILVKNDLNDLLTAVDLSKTVFKRIRANFVWALGYNLLGIPIAAGLFFPLLKVRLPPTLAGLAMALSSVSVVISSLLLKRYTPPQLPEAAAGTGKKPDRVACPCNTCSCTDDVVRYVYTELKGSTAASKGVQLTKMKKKGCSCGCSQGLPCVCHLSRAAGVKHRAKWKKQQQGKSLLHDAEDTEEPEEEAYHPDDIELSEVGTKTFGASTFGQTLGDTKFYTPHNIQRRVSPMDDDDDDEEEGDANDGTLYFTQLEGNLTDLHVEPLTIHALSSSSNTAV